MDPFAPDWTETVLRPLASRANAGEPGPHLSDELFQQLWPWAVQTADQMARRLPPTADGDALRGEVLLEILQATRRIDWHRYRTWPAFLRSRLRNAWSTTARAEDPLSRSQRAARRALLAAEEELTHSLGREPTSTETAELAGCLSPGLHGRDVSVRFGTAVLATAPDALPEVPTSADDDPATQTERLATRQAVRSWIDHDLPPHVAAEIKTLLAHDKGDRLSRDLLRRLKPFLGPLLQRLDREDRLHSSPESSSA